MSTTDLPALKADATEVPFSRLLRAEIRKLTDTRASRWLLAVVIAATPIVTALIVFTSDPDELTYNDLTTIVSVPQKYLLPIVGILTMTSEWSQRTGLLTFTLEPNRIRVLLAKAVATLLLGLVVLVLTFGCSAAGNLLGAEIRDGNGSWADGVAATRDISIVLMMGLAQGLAFGMLFLATATAIVTFLLVPNLSAVIFGPRFGLSDIGAWVDYNQSHGQLYNHNLTGEGWAQVATATLIWIVLPGALGVMRVLRTEIKST